MNKFWQIRNISEEEAEIVLYGEIYSDGELWLDEEGNITTPRQFYEDLKALGDVKNITVRINSIGGDIFAAQAIYTQLKSHKAKVIAIVDGIAASAASVVAMAGDVVKMPNNALMMIHNPAMGMLGYFTADEMKKYAKQLEVVKEGIVNAYAAKTGLDTEIISRMMDKETWMTGKEAKELGFVDEVLFEDVPVAAHGEVLIMNGVRHDMSKLSVPLPKIIDGVSPENVSMETADEDEPWEAPNLEDFTDKSWDELTDTEKRRIAGHFAWAASMLPEKYGDLKLPHHRPSDGKVVWRGVANAAARLEQSNIPQADMNKVKNHLGRHYEQFDRTPPWEDKAENHKNKKGGKLVDVKTVDELRILYPDLITKIEAAAREEGMKAERERIKAIDEIASVMPKDLETKAKFESPMTVEQVAIELLKIEAAKKKEAMAKMVADSHDSGVDDINVAPETNDDKAKKEVVIKSMAELISKRRAKK